MVLKCIFHEHKWATSNFCLSRTPEKNILTKTTHIYLYSIIIHTRISYTAKAYYILNGYAIPLSNPYSIRTRSSAENAVEVPSSFVRRLKRCPRWQQVSVYLYFRPHDYVVEASVPMDTDLIQNRADPVAYWGTAMEPSSCGCEIGVRSEWGWLNGELTVPTGGGGGGWIFPT